MKNFFLSVCLAMLVCHIPSFANEDESNCPVVINEFMAKNDSLFADANGGYNDWIELYNTSDQSCNLSSYLLGDSKNQWMIPQNTIIEGKGYLLIWAGGSEAKGELHADFKLSKKEDKVILYYKNARTIIDQYNFKNAETNKSIGRHGDGATSWISYSRATPNKANQQIDLVSKFNLHDIYPNPVDAQAKIRVELHDKMNVSLKVYDISGNEIKSLVDEKKDSKYYEFDLNTINLDPGIYYYKLETKKYYEVKSFVKVR